MIASSSTMPTLLSSGNDSGWGGSGALIAILALAFCGGGFGGWGNRGGNDNAEINGRFNGIENDILNLGNREDLARNLEATCMTQRDILEAKYDLGNQVAQNRFDETVLNLAKSSA